VKERQTVHEVAADYGVHPTPISQWTRQLLEGGAELCSSRRQKRAHAGEVLPAELYQEIGRLKMALEWLKKKLPPSPRATRAMMEGRHPELSVRRQGVWLGLNRASLYDVPAQESAETVALMRVIDAHDTRTPCSGSRRITADRHRQG
jgi:putative transposase